MRRPRPPQEPAPKTLPRFSGGYPGHPEDPRAPAHVRRDGVRVAERPGPAEMTRRRDAVAQLMTAGMGRDGIVRVCASEFGMTEHQAIEMRRAILLEWKRQHEEDATFLRVEQLQRLRRRLTDIAANPKASPHDHVAVERLYAAVAGTLEPVKVQLDVDATVKGALLAIVSDMTPADRERLIVEQRLLEQKARAN